MANQRSTSKTLKIILIIVLILVICLGALTFYIYGMGASYKDWSKAANDKLKPTIVLEGDGELEYMLGTEFSDPGYSAKDNEGNDLTDKVKVDASQLDRVGKRQIIYTVKDADGNYRKVTRSVNVSANKTYETPGLPICMYHYVYDENNPPADLYSRYGNYISAQALEEEINWLKSEDYYFPTWDEVRDYVDGKLVLPDKSIVLTFDDGSKSFLDCGIPVLDKCQVPATSFVITTNDGEKKVEKYQSDYVSYQSHSHNMHRPGGNIGHGGIFTALSQEEAVADLEKSIEIVGNGDAFAYPYGDYNDSCINSVEAAGFKCAVTTQPGKVRPGDNPYLLPRQRMSLGQTLESFQSKVLPDKQTIRASDYYRSKQ